VRLPFKSANDIPDILRKLRSVEADMASLPAHGKLCGLRHLVRFALHRTVCTLPAVLRRWWSESKKRECKVFLKLFIESSVSTHLAAREMVMMKWRFEEE